MTINVLSTVMFSLTAGTIALAIVSSIHHLDSRNSKPNPFLIGLLVLLLLHTLGELIIASGWYRYAPELVGLESPLRMLMGPALYLYAHSMTSREKLDLYKTLVIAMIGPFLVVVLMLPYFELSADQRVALGDPATRDPALFREIQIICVATSMVFTIVTLAYLAGALRLQKAHKEATMDYFANIETRALDWLRVMLYVWGLVWCLYIVDRALWVMGMRPSELGVALTLSKAFAVLAFAHLALQQQSTQLDTRRIATDTKREEPTPELEPEIAKAPMRSPAERKPALSSERMALIASKLKTAMEVEHLFSDNDLSLRHLADATNTSENHLSETFSQHLNTNFFQFVNKYRIARAKVLLESTELSITTIAYEVGYNSRSTFNAAFKKDSSLTPTGYRNHALGLDKEEHYSS